jgi:NDP-sugar pyrophosphorylase family protein
MLLAAGRGERMEPLSSLIAKPALEVLGRPLLASSLDALRRAGCRRVVVNLHRHPEQVAAAARGAAAHDVTLHFSGEPQLLGGAGGIANARPLLGPGDVLVANADVWSELDLSPLADGAPDEAVLGLLPHPDPGRWSSVVLDRDGFVRDLLPAGAPAAGAAWLFTGFQRLGASVVAGLPEPPAEMPPLWRRLIGAGRLRGVVLAGRWREAGDPEAYRALVVDRLAGGSWIDPGAELGPRARLVASALGRSCRVGEAALLERSVVTAGAAIGAGCVLHECVVAGRVRVPDGRRLERLLVLPDREAPLGR